MTELDSFEETNTEDKVVPECSRYRIQLRKQPKHNYLCSSCVLKSQHTLISAVVVVVYRGKGLMLPAVLWNNFLVSQRV
jgi:hypothetical protein